MQVHLMNPFFIGISYSDQDLPPYIIPVECIKLCEYGSPKQLNPHHQRMYCPVQCSPSKLISKQNPVVVYRGSGGRGGEGGEFFLKMWIHVRNITTPPAPLFFLKHCNIVIS